MKRESMEVILVKGYGDYVLVGSNDRRFSETFGGLYKVPEARLFEEMIRIKDQVRKVFGEETNFEVRS